MCKNETGMVMVLAAAVGGPIGTGTAYIIALQMAGSWLYR